MIVLVDASVPYVLEPLNNKARSLKGKLILRTLLPFDKGLFTYIMFVSTALCGNIAEDKYC